MFALAFSLSIAILAAGLFRVGPTHTRSQELIVIDTDPGIDDAVALLTVLGDPKFKVLGITVVRGNTDVPQAIINTLKILQIANALDVPVYAGQNMGLLESPTSDAWFGEDGFGDLPCPNPPSLSLLQETHAAIFLAKAVEINPGRVTILAIGPLTNIALAIHLNSNFLKQAKKIVFLGGSTRGKGNVAPGIEFNFYMDPDAASLVLDRAYADRVRLIQVSMETGLDYDLGIGWRWNEFTKINNPVVSFLNVLEKKSLELHPSNKFFPYDTYAAAVAISEDVVTLWNFLYGFVENKGQRTKGALMVDHHNVTLYAANLEVAEVVNITAIQNLMMTNFARFN